MSVPQIRPFVPAKDLARSCDFYEELGFKPLFRDANLAILDYEGAGFLLQNYYVQAWAENCMIQLVVKDLDDWWLRTAGLDARFDVQKPRAPEMQPWGNRVGFVFDPCGVLLHVCQGE